MGNVGNYSHSVCKSACEMLQFYVLEIYGVEVASFQSYTYFLLFSPNCSLVARYNILLYNNIVVIDVLLTALQQIFIVIRKFTIFPK